MTANAILQLALYLVVLIALAKPLGWFMARAWMILLMCLIAAAGSGEPGGGEPVTPIQPSQHLDAAKIALGRKLFHDPRLSRGDVVACSTCHPLQSGGADGRVRSLGNDGWPLDFNTPTVFNVSGNARLNWKGNFRTLEGQNEQVLRYPRIMNANWDELLSKLRNDSDYRMDFSAIYGSGPTRVDVLDALACTAVARRIHAGLAQPFPDPPQRDEYGLPMAIWA